MLLLLLSQFSSFHLVCALLFLFFFVFVLCHDLLLSTHTRSSFLLTHTLLISSTLSLFHSHSPSHSLLLSACLHSIIITHSTTNPFLSPFLRPSFLTHLFSERLGQSSPAIHLILQPATTSRPFLAHISCIPFFWFFFFVHTRLNPPLTAQHQQARNPQKKTTSLPTPPFSIATVTTTAQNSKS